MATHDETLTDGLRTPDLIGSQVVFGRSLTDGFTSEDGLTYLYGSILTEAVRVGELLPATLKYHLAQLESVRLREGLFRALPMVIDEAIETSDILTLLTGLAVVDRLRITDAMFPAGVYQRSITERLRTADSLARFFGVDVTDAVELDDLLAPAFFKGAQLSESIEITEDLDRLFLLRVVATDEVVIDDSNVLNLIFDAELAEGIDILAGLQLPGAGFTTWAMNTRTGAVTEYRNYAFNSFARVDNRYLGASENGLYELQGDDDDGEDVVATIRSGFAQWAGAHLHSFKAAYLAVAGSGRFVLRLITGDGKIYNYTVSQDNLRTTKVNTGKGLRARYFAFELVSEGQDFDLETLEFIPLVNQRRV